MSHKVQADGFVERDGPLLFVMVHAESMYFIDLLDHGSFADDQLLQIVHDNWSGTIALFRAPTIARSFGPPISPEDRRKARKCMVVQRQAADGTVYFPPGGGASTAGLSPRVVSDADHLRERALGAEEWVRHSAEGIRDAIAQQTGSFVEELHLKFVLRDPLSVLETQTNVLIPLRFEERANAPVQF